MIRWIAIIVIIVAILIAVDVFFGLFGGNFSGIFGLEPEGAVVVDDAVVVDPDGDETIVTE
ncbi:hypothetical protein [Pseudoroseicyclus tamaricis]|uniref:Uncharacterized protein n=1 Tax=Pseudoroseicyclus tamaricis TaxID=2705421 RepID=A0A6B2K037_9RHOB|nr:hypothetical protein [Pseudoroseicyclus tamaricis]NDV01814.1 hypothetical protein [Pseudoroseicyclus tamaricis]